MEGSSDRFPGGGAARGKAGVEASGCLVWGNNKKEGNSSEHCWKEKPLKAGSGGPGGGGGNKFMRRQGKFSYYVENSEKKPYQYIRNFGWATCHSAHSRSPNPPSMTARCPCTLTSLRADFFLFLCPPLSCLQAEGKFAWSSTRAAHLAFTGAVGVVTAALLGFSFYYWFGTGVSFSFWAKLATLTDWGLLLTIVHFVLFIVRAAVTPPPWWEARLGTALLHLWPTIFCLQAVILILFWSGASGQQIVSAGNIPAHLVFPVMLLPFVALSRAFVPAMAIIAPLFTGVLYLLVNGIYVLATHTPIYPVLSWTSGSTAAVIFIGLAIELVIFACLFYFSRWRDEKSAAWRQAGPQLATAA